MNYYDTIRAIVPFPLSEAIIANVVVGSMTFAEGHRVAHMLRQWLLKRQENTDGDGI